MDRAKALAIIFVVLGHISDPEGPLWAGLLRVSIYSFHMPLFMYLSGFVFVHTTSHVMKQDFGRYILNRANRLLVPFFVMAVVVTSLKLAASPYADLNRSPLGLFEAYSSIFIHTSQSPALDLWYLFVLFVFSIATPALFKIAGSRFWPLLVLSASMYVAFAETAAAGWLTDDFYFSRMCWFYVFFMVGCLASAYSNAWLPLIDRTWPLLLVLFLVTDIYFLLFCPFNLEWRYFCVGLLSAGSIHGLMRSGWFARDKLLLLISESTLSIYLFNTIFVAAAHSLFVRFARPADNMLILYLISFPCGLIGPMLLRRIIAQLSWMRRVSYYLT